MRLSSRTMRSAFAALPDTVNETTKDMTMLASEAPQVTAAPYACERSSPVTR